MNKPRILATLLLSIAVCATLVPAFGQQKPKPKEPPPDYFPLRAGDWWKYKSTAGSNSSEFTMKVLAAEKQADGTILYEVETVAGTRPMIRDWYSKPQGWVLVHKQLYLANNMSANFDPVRQYLKNPLGAGATWGWKGAGMMGVAIDETSKVVGSEEVIVPAGKFQAMKVTTSLTQGGAPVTKTYWYANWIGLVKSMTESGPIKSTTELVDYSFKKP
jgi:hypothetical protein